MFTHKLTQQSFRGVLVASALDQCVKNKPILIDRAPKPMFRTIDWDDDFIEMPFVAKLRRAAADFIGEVPTKFLRPTRTVSWLTTIPRMASMSSTIRRLSGKRK